MSTAKVLLVDDDKDFRTALADMLRIKGIEVKEAGDGGSALRIAGKEAFDLIISDIRMPDLDGVALLQEIKRTSNVPVVIMTAFADEAEWGDVCEAGADGFLQKPFTMLQLMQSIQGFFPNEESAEVDQKIENLEEAQKLAGQLSVLMYNVAPQILYAALPIWSIHLGEEYSTITNLTEQRFRKLLKSGSVRQSTEKTYPKQRNAPLRAMKIQIATNDNAFGDYDFDIISLSASPNDTNFCYVVTLRERVLGWTENFALSSQELSVLGDFIKNISDDMPVPIKTLWFENKNQTGFLQIVASLSVDRSMAAQAKTQLLKQKPNQIQRFSDESWNHARWFFGKSRVDASFASELNNFFHSTWSNFENWYMPQWLLWDNGTKVLNSPFERIVSLKLASPEAIQSLVDKYISTSPLELRKQIDESLDQIRSHIKRTARWD